MPNAVAYAAIAVGPYAAAMPADRARVMSLRLARDCRSCLRRAYIMRAWSYIADF